MTSLETALGRLTEKRINTRMEEIAAWSVEAQAPDYPTYMKRVGEYQGLKNALTILRDAEKEIAQNN